MSIAGKHPHRCDVVAEDEDLVAGAHVLETDNLMSMVTEDLPPEPEEAEELPPSIPEDREIRMVIAIPWFILPAVPL